MNFDDKNKLLEQSVDSLKNLDVLGWDDLNIEGKNKIAYWICYGHCRMMDLFASNVMGSNNTSKNWGTKKHFEEWVKDKGNDWRNLVKYRLKTGE